MPSLVSLAEELLAQAREFEEILKQNNVPDPSFDKDTLEALPDDAQKLRREILNASHDLRQLVRGPRLAGMDIAFSWTENAMLRIVWRYSIASAVPIDGSATYAEISILTGLEVSHVIRVIRVAMNFNIFDEAEPGWVRHTAFSRLLAVDEGFSNLIGLQLENMAPASLKLIEAWKNNEHNEGKPEQSAFGLENGGRSFYTVLAEEPEVAHRFQSAVKWSSEDKSLNGSDIVNAFDWAALDKPGSQLIDLGGGYGQICQELAGHTKNLNFVIQDLPHVVEQGRQRLPSVFEERVSFEVQNFLEPQEPRKHAADTYLISRCLHNWSDHQSARILRALIPALKSTSRVLIWEFVMDDKPVKKLSERWNLQSDFIMATITNGKERSLEDFRQLLKMSDERFRIENIKQPEGCKLSLIEISWAG